MKRVAFLPLDDRPVNYDYPRYLARAAGLELHLPPREWLGNPWRASRHADLISWLAQAATDADALIVAIDTLAYGGLIPSRTSTESAEIVLERLEILRELKRARPEQTILASSVILRISRADSSEEEKDYWATYGRRMFRLSYLEHKRALDEASAAEIDECETVRKQIPAAIYTDYRQGRIRNNAVNHAMLAWLADGVFDYLLLPQDDTADYGWNIAEARELQALIRARGLIERAITYPGADEIGCLLLARYACQQANFAPRVFPRYSCENGASVITAYEDRPLQELIKAHLAPLNGSLANSPESADLLLFMNAPAYGQGEALCQLVIERGLDSVCAQLPAHFQAHLEQMAADDSYRATRREMQTPRRSPEEFIRAIRSALVSDKPVALADVVFVNGADLHLGRMLLADSKFVRLAAYGGWNTAGNTLGTVLAQAVIRVLALRAGDSKERYTAHLEFLFLRFLDDYFYQAEERTGAMFDDLPLFGLVPSMERIPDEKAAAIEACVGGRLTRAFAALRNLFNHSGLVSDVTISNIYLPWQRLFEIGFDIEVKLP